MKILAIRLRNVRLFAGTTASITGLGDGIMTICEPNESGKSTFLDALHALMFFDHKSGAAEIRALQPYSKGAVEISADIEVQDGQFRIGKKFLSSRSATVTELASGRIIAQEGEAESWISKALGTDMAGPAGLLWVRQGTSGFGPGGTGPSERRERERMREARQTLMSTVAGQIDSITGGRRLDAIMDRVEADLDALATKSLNPKTNGEWGKAVKLAEEFSRERDALQSQVENLTSALKERAALKARLGDPRDVETDAGRKQRISEIEEKLEEARRHDREVQNAEREMKLAELELRGIEARHSAIEGMARRRLQLKARIVQAESELRDAIEAAQDDETGFRRAEMAHSKALASLKTARAAERVVRDRKERDALQVRRNEILETLKQVDAYEKKLREAREKFRDAKLTRETLEDLEEMSRRHGAALEQRAAGTASMIVHYEGQARITGNGEELAGDEDIPIQSAISLDLPGIGRMNLSPPRLSGQAGANPEQIAAERDDRLSALGYADLAQARAALAIIEAARSDAGIAQEAIRALARDGTDALRRELNELPVGDAEDSTDDPECEPVLPVEGAEAVEVEALARLNATRRDRDGTAGRLLSAETTLTIARTALADFEAESEEAEVGEDLDSAKSSALQKFEDTRRVRDTLAQGGGDTEALEADHSRLVSARENAQAERDRMQSRVFELDGQIGARAGDGIEGRLEEVKGELEKAQGRADRYAFEVKALDELRRALDMARSEARDAYFEPVKKELGPLIAMLHEGAEFEMDSETMLPVRLVRNGIEDDFEVLSGGAAEQIAILTRLAFARLYAGQGRRVPVILDDALVYSDDDRIIRMFTALTRMSKEQQIIVFSCRSRAFEELGGHRLHIEIEK